MKVVFRANSAGRWMGLSSVEADPATHHQLSRQVMNLFARGDVQAVDITFTDGRSLQFMSEGDSGSD